MYIVHPTSAEYDQHTWTIYLHNELSRHTYLLICSHRYTRVARLHIVTIYNIHKQDERLLTEMQMAGGQ